MSVSRYSVELAASALTAAIAVLVGGSSYALGIGWSDAGPESGYFPFYISVLLFLGSVGTLVSALRARHRLGQPFIESGRGGAVAVFTLTLLVFSLLCSLVGMYPAVALYLGGITWWKGGLRPVRAIALGLGATGFLFVAFEYAFQLPLPKGPLLNLLGMY